MRLRFAKKSAKHPLQSLTKAQLIDLVQVLKLGVKQAEATADSASKTALEKSVAYSRVVEKGNGLQHELNAMRNRARECQDYVDHPTSFERAAFEYIAYGDKGAGSMGVHPFKRWNLPTPAERKMHREVEGDSRQYVGLFKQRDW